MPDTLSRIRALVARQAIRVSRHGFRELSADDIYLDDVIRGVEAAVLVEDYPEAWKGPTVLVLQRGSDDEPIHVVWALPQEMDVAVLVTTYRPDPERWSADLMRRRL